MKLLQKLQGVMLRVPGEKFFHDWIGEGNNPIGEPKYPEGSEYLQEVFDKDDDCNLISS